MQKGDTVDGDISKEWLQNIEQVLEGREPDYLVIQHMEPDHSASIPALLGKYPQTSVVSTAMGFQYMEQFFSETEIELGKRLVAANGGTLELGSHTLHFVYAPMAAKLIKGLFEKSKDIIFADTNITIKSAMNEQNKAMIDKMAEEMLR